jgi:nitroimidazol reductase NimA-like FMN-containing flavoprotein (pyridoxamine 5'-phosphate oxidase superfamily)
MLTAELTIAGGPERRGTGINEMTKEECCDLLARLRFRRLACAHDNRPYVVPTYFAYGLDHIYAFAAALCAGTPFS